MKMHPDDSVLITDYTICLQTVAVTCSIMLEAWLQVLAAKMVKKLKKQLNGKCNFLIVRISC